ncbi:MAG: hypothetical protein JXR97_01665, partial [Planctomycetes bacterium]|nr:hypothetical protein [Planctomycetota bacterium]
GPASTRIHVADSCRETLGNRTDVISETNSYPNFAIRRHDDGANVMFVDNHTKWFDAETIKQKLTNSFVLKE